MRFFKFSVDLTLTALEELSLTLLLFLIFDDIAGQYFFRKFELSIGLKSHFNGFKLPQNFSLELYRQQLPS